MSIAILECSADSITFTSFVIKNDVISIDNQVKRSFKCASNDWINFASIAIKALVNQFKISFPIIILLPEFALLTKVVKVPLVVPLKQKHILHFHISHLLGISEKECLGFSILSSNAVEMDIICSLVKKDWIESFCNSIESISANIESIQPSVIHYYNAFKLLLPLLIKNTLLIVFDELIASCIFFNGKDLFVSKIQFRNEDINVAITELLQFYNSKYPNSMPEEVLVSGLREPCRNLLDSLSTDIHLPIKTFAPLVDDHSCPLGSIGFVYAKLSNKGLFIDLTPSPVRKRWIFNRCKKALFFTGSAIIAACILFLITINHQQSHYDELIHNYQNKIIPLKDKALTIYSNEKVIKLYDEGLNALQAQVQSSNSWVSFLNSLQSILIKFPMIHIHSLAIINSEPQEQDSWAAMMGIENAQNLSKEPRLLNIGGVLQINNPNTAPNEMIDGVRSFIAQLNKLHFIEDTKNLSFDMQSFPSVPFSVSLLLKPQAL